MCQALSEIAFVQIMTFSFHNNPVTEVLYHSCFTDEDTEAQKDQMTCPVSQS